MKKQFLSLCMVLAMVLVPAATLAQTELTILAAASLTDALTEIGQMYQLSHPDVKPVFSFAASGALQTQIEQGAPCDLFVSAAQKQMDALEEQNLLDADSRIDLLENKVVLIVPKGKEAPASFETIGDAPVIAIGEPGSVPVGQYSMEIFDALGLTEALTAEEGKLINAKDVREVLTYVATGNVDAGIVYATDAMTEENVTVMAQAPEGSHKPVIYPAAVITSSAQSESAKDFLAFLTTPSVSEVFSKYGFTALAALEDAPEATPETAPQK